MNLDEAAKGKILMAELPHGRYYAQELVLDQATSKREQIQDALDAGDIREWHLVGVSDVLVDDVLVEGGALSSSGTPLGPMSAASPGAPSNVPTTSCRFIALNFREFSLAAIRFLSFAGL